MSETRLDRAAREAAEAVLEHECIYTLFDGTEAHAHAQTAIRAAMARLILEAARHGEETLGPDHSWWLLSWAGLEDSK